MIDSVNMTAGLSTLTTESAASPFDRSRSTAFAAQLSRAKQDDDRDTLRASVEQMVSSALVLPTLATLRESKMSTAPFSPGAAERRFGPLLDQHLADQVTKGANFPLVDAIVSRLAQSYGLKPSPTTPTGREPLNA